MGGNRPRTSATLVVKHLSPLPVWFPGDGSSDGLVAMELQYTATHRDAVKTAHSLTALLFHLIQRGSARAFIAFDLA